MGNKMIGLGRSANRKKQECWENKDGGRDKGGTFHGYNSPRGDIDAK
jgi:hypothetical protein